MYFTIKNLTDNRATILSKTKIRETCRQSYYAAISLGVDGAQSKCVFP